MTDDTITSDAGSRGGRTTAASVVCSKIRQDILAGALAPGARLKVETVRARYDATINPVREALNRLVAEGLVEVYDQRGFSVAPISLSQWRDLVHARCLVEGTALREAIARRTDAWEDEIILSLHRLKRTPRFLPGDSRLPDPTWESAHKRFHKALLSTAGSDLLIKFCGDLGEQAARYRHIASIAPTARTDYDDEHQAIADACIAGEGDRAAALLEAHYRITFGIVEGYLRTLDPAPDTP